MDRYIPGQRWISNTEPELGLGIILETVNNRVAIRFLASGQKRVYAGENSPLTRVKFAVGDEVQSVDGEILIVDSLIERNGLVTYVGKNPAGKEIFVDEMKLNYHLQFNKPQDRLFTGQFDPAAWFSLRFETWRRLQEHQRAPIKGLMGGRTSLLRHQLFIAYETAKRWAPRVMLADEVGLGKTIEAGLILHHRLINGLSRRVLIIVPETLLHQWLVEMLRRFNLHFSIIDEERCLRHALDDSGSIHEFAAIDEAPDQENPFLAEQLVLCSQTFFSSNANRQAQALAAGWDMVVVDEVHHLEWNESLPSPEYCFVEQLGQRSTGLILLTATPEQLGKASHFARLRLLDPDRFYSFAEFVAEEDAFEPIAKAAQSLLGAQSISAESVELLTMLLKNDHAEGLLDLVNDPESSRDARDQLIDILLDYHGTSRILFRNSRHTVKDFPVRHCHPYPLSGALPVNDLQSDPRYHWLVDQIKALTGQKALLICKEASTATALEQLLKNRAGIASALFHEGMTIIERDRAAAFFADQESSARLLICSEIGSEGRNFQFLHHLILWDLPDNPDLLQQRIGRLDRIGQRQDIQIHVPYLKDTCQERWFRWYDEGLNAFICNSSAARSVADRLRNELVDDAMKDRSADHFARLIAQTQLLKTDLEAHLHNGRDLLLELNSCRNDQADRLIAELHAYENAGTLWPYMEDVFECYGVETEYHSPDCFIVRPGDHLRVDHFPSLPADGVTVTVNRQCALAREDFQFLTWEHPMVTAAMDLVLSSETGNASVGVIRHPQLKTGQFLLECLFIVECSAPEALQISRFLPHAPIRVLIDQNNRDLSDAIAHDALKETGIHYDKNKIVAFINSLRSHVTGMLALAEKRASAGMRILVDEAAQTMMTSLNAESRRLESLQKVNPNIKTEEIEHLKDMAVLAHGEIHAAELRLDALRLLITS